MTDLPSGTCVGYPFHPGRIEAQFDYGTLHRHDEIYDPLERKQPC